MNPLCATDWASDSLLFAFKDIERVKLQCAMSTKWRYSCVFQLPFTLEVRTFSIFAEMILDLWYAKCVAVFPDIYAIPFITTVCVGMCTVR